MATNEEGGGVAGRRRIGLGLVLVVLFATLALSAAVKQPCASGDWSDGRQYRRLCYSDIVPLYATEQLEGGRLPYLDPCRPGPGSCDEYPVLTMYAMRAAAWGSGGFARFFTANAILLAVAAAVVAVCLYLIAGGRALFFALAPTLLLHAFTNWDLIAVALATGATLAFLNRRNVAAGVLIGLGAAAKLYPGLLLVPFVLHRFRRKDPDGGIHLAWAAGATWLAVNLPFALGTSGWWQFFRLSSRRPSDWDSLWTIACNRATGAQSCPQTGLVNLESFLLFAAVAVFLWWLKDRRQPDFPAWTFAFPLLVVFLLTSKVYSPQYSLWLLPWFALVLPDRRLFALFGLAEVAVFVTRFAWFGNLSDEIGGWVDGVGIGMFQLAVLARAAVLVLCLVVWMRRTQEDLPGAAGVEVAV